MLVIDTDPGLDDAHALAMASQVFAPNQLVITTVAGNLGIDTTTKNACWLMEQFCSSAPIYRGASAPLVGDRVEASHVHGVDGLAGYPRSKAARAICTAPAAQALVELAHRNPGTLDIVALGPLTNLAIAVMLEPRLPDLVRSLTIMGGSPAQHGNASLNAELNVFANPAAAEAVFARMANIRLVTWDLCLCYPVSSGEMAGLWAGESVQAQLLKAISAHWHDEHSEQPPDPSFILADPIAMAIALHPDIVAGSSCHRVRVVYGEGIAHGITVVDEQDATGDLAPVRIIEKLNREALIRALSL